MIIECQGKNYDSREMMTCTTGNPAVWRICIAPDWSGAVVLGVNPRVGLVTHEATAAEVQALAARYPFRELRELAARLERRAEEAHRRGEAGRGIGLNVHS